MNIWQTTIKSFLKISIRAITKSLKLVRFDPDNLKLGKNEVKQLTFVLRYVLDQNKIQQLCDKAVVENGGAFKCVTDNYKNHKMCNQAVYNYVDAL